MSQHDAVQQERAARTPIMLCADDYGLTPGVGVAIRALIEAGCIGATSCMTASSYWPEEARRLAPLRSHADIGLHLTLTDHAPLGPMPRLAPAGRLPPLGRLLALALAGRLDRAEIAAEATRQYDAFEAAMGAPPDHLDGHHHVHQLPGVREVVVELFRRRRPPAWLRYCDEPLGSVARVGVAAPRAALIGLLGRGLRRSGLPGNRGFRGVRSFREGLPYAELFGRFLTGLEAGGLVMCHPALADDALRQADPVADRREEEFRFLAGNGLAALAAAGLRVARFSSLNGAFTSA